MKKISTVAILGAGAMGAYFSTRFFLVEAFKTVLVAKDERLNRLRKEGLVVNGELFHLPVIDPELANEPFDLIIVALKHHHLSEAIPQLKNLIGDQTTIISVMNGLDSERTIGAIHGMDKLLYTVSVGIDAVRDNNCTVYSKPGIHYFGEADNSVLSEKVLRVQTAFERAGIAYETPPDMIRMLWWKFMINVGMNPSSAVMRAPYGVFQTMPEARNLMESMMQEVILLAKAEGVNLSEKDLDQWITVLNTLSPQGKTSMLQDMEAGTKTEIEIFSQKVVELGKAHDIPTPVNQSILQIVNVLEVTAKRSLN